MFEEVRRDVILRDWFFRSTRLDSTRIIRSSIDITFSGSDEWRVIADGEVVESRQLVQVNTESSSVVLIV